MSKSELVIQISQEELAVRIFEGVLGMKRPEGKTAMDCLESMPEENREEFMRAAMKAMEYFVECTNQGQRVS